MSKLIDSSATLREDTWVAFDGDAGAVQSGAAVLLPLDVWREYRQQWIGHDGPVGVQLSPADDVTVLAADLDRLSLIAVSFPAFTDGRGYSQARLIRERLGYTGELRAVGDVLVDQLAFLRRCGFDRFALRDDQSLETAARTFGALSLHYQSGVGESPLFRRRALADAAQAAALTAARDQAAAAEAAA